MFRTFILLISLLRVVSERFSAAGHLMIREATEDTIIRIPNPVGQEGTTTMPIPKGLTVSNKIQL